MTNILSLNDFLQDNIEIFFCKITFNDFLQDNICQMKIKKHFVV